MHMSSEVHFRRRLCAHLRNLVADFKPFSTKRLIAYNLFEYILESPKTHKLLVLMILL